jgi:hypothetical protein
MQGLFSFWHQDYTHTNEKHACSTPRPISLVRHYTHNTPSKRKRTEREETSSSPPPDKNTAKRRKRTTTPTELPAQSSPSKVVAPSVTPEEPETLVRAGTHDRTSASTPVSADPAPAIVDDNTQQIQAINPRLLEYAIERIEAHLNLEILFKHNEHRLIEQELAKCQIAQEQLRRCRLIPYPGQLGGFAVADDIAAGMGPAITSQEEFTQPAHGAAWGVTDGPYTQHYAHWLLPDPRFHPSPKRRRIEAPANTAGKVPTRSARGSEPSTRSQRRSTATMTFTGRDSAGPLTIRRASDGVMVKLICKICGKDNVNSLQGFLNHCRIQHKQDYASHGAALDDCGIPLDAVELASLNMSGVAETQSSATNVVIPLNSSSLVHPLIREDRREPRPSTSTEPMSILPPARSARPDTSAMPPPIIPPRWATGVPANQSNPFIPSPALPRLSALIASKGGSGDMLSLTQHMQDKSDFNNILAQTQGDEDTSPPKPSPKVKARNGGRQRSVARGVSAARGPITLQLPPHRLASIANQGSAGTLGSSSTHFGKPGQATAAIDATASTWTSTSQSALARKLPATSDVAAFTSTSGQQSFVPNSSSGYGSVLSSFSVSQPLRGNKRDDGPYTPMDVTSAEVADISPTQTGDNPGLMTDNEESRTHDEESDVNMDVDGPAILRIRTSIDDTEGGDDKAAGE